MLELFDMLIHIDKTLGVWIAEYGTWVYVVLFLIIFGETGLVVLPFLPGDSLLFIAGAFSASGHMHPGFLIALLIAAAILGNTLNYFIGRSIGVRVYSMNLRFLDRNALARTHAFYEKHGGKTVILARFIPLVRTFAPFVAGVAAMPFARFQLFNIVGAVTWVMSLVLGGYFFGNLPFVREHLNTIVLLGIASALLPLVVVGVWKGMRRFRRKAVVTL
jgi:membrane-associated protein